MRKPKSKLITYFLSFLPGVGFMYRGYMKKGFSYFATFLCGISIIDWLKIGVLSVLPVLFWFYAFFDQINTFSLAKEEEHEMKDEFLLQKYFHKMDREFFEKNHKIIGWLFIGTGGYGLIQGAYLSFLTLLPEWIRTKAYDMMRYIPRLLLAGIIIYLGLKLLEGKIPIFDFFRKKSQDPNQREQLLAANVVYYMEKGTQDTNNSQGLNQVEQNVNESEESILACVSKEQLIRKAKELLDDDIYQSIHIEKPTEMEAMNLEPAVVIEPAATIESVHTHVEPAKSIEPATVIESAAAIEPAAAIESAAEIEKSSEIEKIEVEKCPDLF